jgi:predicted amidohydrolase
MKGNFFHLSGFLLPIFLFSGLVFAAAEHGGGKVAPIVTAVQYEVKIENYRSPARFTGSIEACAAKAAAQGAELLVFPEYINVFLSLSEEIEALAEVKSMEEAAVMLGGTMSRDFLRRLLAERSDRVRELMDEIWGGAARRYSVWIVAGSYFALEGGELYNRAVVYDPEGKTVYHQDKVYLTPFETEQAGLSAGTVEKAELFDAAGLRCGLTICRDSFFDRWNDVFQEADLWIDIKANGEEYRPETKELFEAALPERIGETGIPFGVTACLNGSFLDLFWEGPSSIIRSIEGSGDGKLWEVIARADSPQAMQQVSARISPFGASGISPKSR